MVKQELPPLCIPVAGQDWNFAGAVAIDEGIEYLNGLGATFNQGRGCGRVSCSYNSAIYICADVSPKSSLPPPLLLRHLCPAYPLALLRLLTNEYFSPDRRALHQLFVCR